ncbi:2,4-dihydroxyhept-2-ene-1,7-dioic acid aldolase [Curtobacterium pusillum]|uniref:4-hydroxy-tetrahydrodipicolinate synthase n=1 Tax=Curtobacterium pusillum TaxID=69373 RepID=A0AAW3T7I9_9MICO|nr:4-hydroxy-tetrahydrodipicolinate synthase [Curtobacterium pusillum]MBA8991154.1 4-hydroxy-tetrahydrodipicolinate synthase [Curtobacterium pusillum]NUU15268.1 4-hydroxy-tetrahydrodipicolinate synthase [Curtobacterium pusillum]GLK31399.1 4-hydroxy-tetrahydrodipicolinate synthase [Curtobacterium pusillum]
MRFRNDPHALRGAFGAVLTPFTDDGDLDVDSLRSLAQWQRDAGLHGLSVGGSTAEPSAQSFEERVTAMRTVASVTADQVPFLPATGSTKLDETIRLTGEARDAGADAVLVITPYYARPTQQGLIEWYGAIAREYPDLPLVVYNVPSRTAVDMAPETVHALRLAHDNIIGIKETTKDFEHFSHVLKLCGQDFMVWSGIELLGIPLLALGGAGFINALSNLAPRSIADMYEHWAAGRLDEARAVHYAVHPLVELLFVETNPAPAKWVLARAGKIASDHVRPPLASVSEAGRAKIDRLLDEAAAVLEYEGLTLERVVA